MEIKGKQLRRLKDLLPENQQEEFKDIFAGAFTKEDVTRACKVVLNFNNAWGTISLLHKEKPIAFIDLRKNPGFIDADEDYIFEVHYSDGKIFRVYKLKE